MPAGQPQRLRALRRQIAAIEGTRATLEDRKILSLGVPAVDSALGGGLACGALHELQPAGQHHLGAAFGFALALAASAQRTCLAGPARPAGDVLWIETAFATSETGRLYGPGLENFGLTLKRVLLVRVKHPREALWVMEEALGCRGIATTIAVTPQDPDLTATRRLSLAARDGGGLGFLLRPSPQPSAALTRWQIAAARSEPDAFGGLGPATFDLTLTKNRHGPCGRWVLSWDSFDGFLDPLSVGVAHAARDRSDRAHALRAG